MTSRRFVLGVVTIAAVGASYFLLYERTEQSPSPIFKLGYLPVADCAALMVASDRGFFEKRGVSVQLVELPDGPTVINAAAKGDLLGGFSGVTPFLNAISKNPPAPIRIVADGGHVPAGRRTPNAVVVPGTSPITSIRQLKGKRLAFLGSRTIEDTIVSALLKAHGMEKSDLTLLTVRQNEKLAVLRKSQVDAVFLSEPYLAEAIHSADVRGRSIATSEDVIPGFQVAVIFATDEAIRHNRSGVAAITAGYRDAITYIKKRPDDARFVVARRLRIQEEKLDLFQHVAFLAWDTKFDTQRLLATRDAMVASKTTDWSGSIEPYVFLE